MNVNYLLSPALVVAFGLAYLMTFAPQARLLRPPDAPIMSWENWLYTLVRWPYIAWGIVRRRPPSIRPRTETFKVTPRARET